MVKKVKQYTKVTYLSCIHDKTLSRESMATIINKINSRLRFFLSTKQVFRYSFM